MQAITWRFLLAAAAVAAAAVGESLVAGDQGEAAEYQLKAIMNIHLTAVVELLLVVEDIQAAVEAVVAHLEC